MIDPIRQQCAHPDCRNTPVCSICEFCAQHCFGCAELAAQAAERKPPMRLLSVDFDSFFPVVERAGQGQPGEWQLYDWGRAETTLFIDGPLWTLRAAGFWRTGRPLPLTDGSEARFWERVDVSHADLFYADSHSQIAIPAVKRGVRQVVSYDAHHDAGYHSTLTLPEWLQRGHVSCEDWALFYAVTGVEVSVIYPRWRAWALDPEHGEAEPKAYVQRKADEGAPLGSFDQVFVCRSGAWVPPWVEDRFWAFLQAAPVQKHRRHNLDGITCRVWREDEAQECLRAFQKADAAKGGAP